MAYPAQLLPSPGWQKVMSSLDDHFGDNAELDETTARKIENYLAYSSRPDHNSNRKLFRNLGSEIPSRITELPYFKHEHDEITEKFVTGKLSTESFFEPEPG